MTSHHECIAIQYLEAIFMETRLRIIMLLEFQFTTIMILYSCRGISK